MASLLRGVEGDSNEEESFSNNFVSPEDVQFDTVVGHIEDILIDQDFQCLQRSFLQKYCHVFTRDEENKLEYMDIFKEYTTVIETYIEEQLRRLIPLFSMQAFINQLENRKTEIDGEVFEMLFSFTDFLVFKDLILDHRSMLEGEVNDLGGCIVVSSCCNTRGHNVVELYCNGKRYSKFPLHLTTTQGFDVLHHLTDEYTCLKLM